MPARPVSANITFLYYRNLARAAQFYEEIMGLTLAVDQGTCRIYEITRGSYIGLVDGEHGTHKPSRDKPVILSFVSDDVDGWHEHLVQHGITIFRPLKTHDSIGVRGFMALDPEGYTLEFETFTDQPRNAVMRSTLGLT
jgi:predicted enzyme related to lactoylglutathione lyase